MKCPLHRTDVVGFLADSVASGNPAWPTPVGGVDFMGERIYRLTETIPTA